MKKNLLKIITLTFFVAAFAFIATHSPVSAQGTNNNPAPVYFDGAPYGFGFNSASNYGDSYGMEKHFEKNMMNKIMPLFAGGFVGIGILAGIIGLLALIFWIWMLVHAIKNNIKNKPLWILILWFMHIIGAIVYYFAVKKSHDHGGHLECVCENGVCVCVPKYSETEAE